LGFRHCGEHLGRCGRYHDRLHGCCH
jgi:hypothetical protein